MNIKKFYLLIILCLVAYNSVGQNIYFFNKTQRKVQIQKRTILEEGSFPYELTTDNKLQSIPIMANMPTMLNVSIVPLTGIYGTRDGIYYLFKPGDTVLINVNKNNQPIITHVTSLKRTKELSVGSNTINNITIKPVYTLPFVDLVNLLNTNTYTITKRDRIIDSLSRPIIKEVAQYCLKNNIDSKIADLYRLNYLCMMYKYKITFDNSVKLDYKANVEKFYRDSLNTWIKNFNNNDCINVPLYNLAARRIFFSKIKGPDSKSILTQLNALATGNTRDFLLSSYMSDLVNNNKDIKPLLPLYTELCKNDLYKKTIENNFLLASSLSQRKGEIATLMSDNKTKIGFNELISKYKGNVIYIDFWASWCAPCLEEIPSSIRLKETLKGKKIKMIYISIDKDFDSWKRSNEINKLKGDDSFVLANSGNDGLSKALELAQIPRYIILNKSGKIIVKDALRPSQKGVSLFLSNLSK